MSEGSCGNEAVFVGHKPALGWAVQQLVHQTLISWRISGHQAVFALCNPLNLEGLTRLYAVLLAQFSWQDDLAL